MRATHAACVAIIVAGLGILRGACAAPVSVAMGIDLGTDNSVVALARKRGELPLRCRQLALRSGRLAGQRDRRALRGGVVVVVQRGGAPLGIAELAAVACTAALGAAALHCLTSLGCL